jgi:excisionase family DNA binding protein
MLTPTRANRRYTRTAEAAEYLGLSKSYIEHDRVSGKLNIPFIRLGNVVLYDLDRLDEWLADRVVTSTSAADALVSNGK